MHHPLATTLFALTAGMLYLAHAPTVAADSHVAVRAFADEAYSARKFGPDGPKLETYVFMEGQYFPGATVDRSISRMSFRAIAVMLSRDLARQNYRPAKDLKSSDLLIVVHWGTTMPTISANEMSARTYVGADPQQAAVAYERALDAMANPDSAPANADPARDGLDDFELTDDMRGDLEFDNMADINEQIAESMGSRSNADLLGYKADLRQFGRSNFTREEERTLRHDLSTERYFIIMKAFDLKTLDKRARPVWTVYMNTRSPGINFKVAVVRLGHAGSFYFGQQNDRVTTIRAKEPKGTVTIEPAIIIGIEE